MSEINNFHLGILILFFEKVDQTIECVGSFMDPGVHIYILNNGSSSESRKKLGEFCSKYSNITIFDSPKNLGPAGGRNYLISNTTEDWLFFADSDITIKTENWLAIVQDLIAKYPDAEVFVPKRLDVHKKKYARNLPIFLRKGKLFVDEKFKGSVINKFSGGASIVNRKMFERLGLYEEKMFAFEEYEIAIRRIVGNCPIKAKITDLIELWHDHRIANNEYDRNAAKSRYDFEKHQVSVEYVRKKYGIHIEPSWKYWIENQKNLLCEGKVAKSLNIFLRIYLKAVRFYRENF